MDPLNKLPSELRVQILILLRCKRSILRFAQASPTMLHQYLASKAYITRTLVALDFDDEMMQDAVSIIQLPPPDDHGDYSEIIHRHYVPWSDKQLPNPLKIRDDSLMDQVHNLQTRLLLFIEDYLTKATAIFPPRDYICLPDLSPNGTHLMFKDQAVSPRFDATELTDAERRRLLRAFLRYELMCAVRHESTPYPEQWNFAPLYKYWGQKYRSRERETLLCVHQYVRSLSAAMFAQCSNSWLPDIPTGSLFSYGTGLLYPDTLYVDALAYASDMGLQSFEVLDPISIETLGFDLVTVLVRSATAGPSGRVHLERWFKDFLEFKRVNRWLFHIVPRVYHLHLDNFEREETKNTPHEESSAMYQMLYSRIGTNHSLQVDIYRQRAWAFFDDDRFYPSPGAGSLFPTNMELGQQWGSTEHDVEWFSNPKHVRALHRSQKWHNERLGKPCGDEGVKESQTEMALRPLLPDTTEENWFRRLPRFWC